jgi:hypothetical protein
MQFAQPGATCCTRKKYSFYKRLSMCVDDHFWILDPCLLLYYNNLILKDKIIRFEISIFWC